MTPPFFKLPTETIDHIVSYMYPAEWKSLRLASKFFHGSTNTLLFKRVILSKAKLDRDAFVNISRSPHLSTIPQELVWYELHNDERTFRDHTSRQRREAQLVGSQQSFQDDDDDPWKRYRKPATKFHGEQVAIVHDPYSTELPPFFNLAEDAFWWTTGVCGDRRYKGMPGEQPMPRKNFWEPQWSWHTEWSWFTKALENMPNINTFISCPMPPSHVLSKHQYILTAGAIQQTFSQGKSCHRGNDGCFLFLLRGTQHLDGRIKKLVYHDEQVESDVSRFSRDNYGAFEQLTRIHLSLSIDEGFRLMPLKFCLAAAKALEELTISLQAGLGGRRVSTAGGVRRLSNKGPTPLENILFSGTFFHDRDRPRPDILWPRLQRLTLEEIRMNHDQKIDIVLSFLKDHSPSVRHLTFRNCGIPARLLKGMSNIEKLELHSLVIAENTDDVDIITVADQMLLDYVKGKNTTLLDNVPAFYTICSGSACDTSSALEGPFTPEHIYELCYTDDEIARISDFLLQRHHHTKAAVTDSNAMRSSHPDNIPPQPMANYIQISNLIETLSTAKMTDFITIREYNNFFRGKADELNTCQTTTSGKDNDHSQWAIPDDLISVWYLKGLSKHLNCWAAHLNNNYTIADLKPWPDTSIPLNELMMRAKEVWDELQPVSSRGFLKVKLGKRALAAAAGDGKDRAAEGSDSWAML